MRRGQHALAGTNKKQDEPKKKVIKKQDEPKKKVIKTKDEPKRRPSTTPLRHHRRVMGDS